MKISKEMLHIDLQPYYWKVNALRPVFGNKILLGAFNTVVRMMKGRNIDGLDCSEVYIPSADGKTRIRTRLYKPLNHEGTLPGLLYLHGGGYMTGTPEMAPNEIKRFIEKRPCVVIAPDYRLSVEAPYPAALNDCCDALVWAKENAGDLGVNPDKFIVAGHSAGGGLTAAVTLRMRDTKQVNIAFQMPIYPMIDDQQPHDPARQMYRTTWDSKTNLFGWGLYLRDLHAKGADIPAYAAPARNHDYTDFPPTISFVGTLEPFHMETVAYMAALEAAGIDVRFKAFEGCFHGFEIIAANTNIGRAGLDYTYDSYAEFYDKYAV